VAERDFGLEGAAKEVFGEVLRLLSEARSEIR